MTRQDKLIAMNGATLIQLADNLGVKVAANRTRTALKEAKSKVVERILAAEAAAAEPEVEETQPVEEVIEDPKPPVEEPTATTQEELPLENVETKEQPTPKRGASLEFNGRAQNICAWAEELGISANTLYGRIYKMNWSIEKAFTTPARATKKK